MIKAMDNDNQLRVIIARTTELADEACKRHGTSATASAALGRVMTGALIMAADLKGQKDMLTLRIDGNGPAGPIIASADARGAVRAFISNPHSDVPSIYPGKLAVGDLVGKKGFIEVIKDLGMKQPFSGKVELVSGEIAEDLASYYLISEQTPSLVALGVMVAPDLTVINAGGVLVQAMPGADDEVLAKVESNVAQMGPISKALEKSPRPEDILRQVMQGIGYNILEKRDLFFKCTCSYERLKNILSTMPMEDINEMCDENNQIEVVCNFCNDIYHFRPEEIAENKKAPD